ncbi:MAG: cbb3-type cytochrome c oxidase subunit I [Isosphaeraceae bacterium]|nr:cbb3-type cytochrome c oxidase subunit I [Isosphaeraceae bacterium]
MMAADSAIEAPRHEKLVDERLVTWYFLFALLYMFVSMLGGFLMASQLVRFTPLRGIELFSPGRWRMVHTNAIAYGFLANAFLGMLHWSVPRLTLRPVLSSRLSYFIFGAWQFIVLSTAAGLLLGEAQGLEWGETPVWIDPLAQVGLLLVLANFMGPISKMSGALYVSLWYYMAAFVWTPLVYAMGNFLPEYFLSGTSAGAVGGLFIHDLVGLFVTPLGWGAMYYFVPILLEKPMWSHGLSLVGFWGLAFFYPLTGIHHFLYTPIPMFLQYGAVISTIAVELVVTTVLVNFFMTLKGSPGVLSKNLPVRWMFTGMVFYGLTCLQCAFQTTLTFQAMIHFTDWVVGHAHMVMFGVFSVWLLGIMTYLFPKLLRRNWASPALCEWHYWLSTVGIGLMSADLITAGPFQGISWASLVPWEVSVEFSMPFWAVRLGAGVLMFAGLLAFLLNIFLTWSAGRRAPAQVPDSYNSYDASLVGSA